VRCAEVQADSSSQVHRATSSSPAPATKAANALTSSPSRPITTASAPEAWSEVDENVVGVEDVVARVPVAPNATDDDAAALPLASDEPLQPERIEFWSRWLASYPDRKQTEKAWGQDKVFRLTGLQHCPTTVLHVSPSSQ
jgi:hypothetical protein